MIIPKEIVEKMEQVNSLMLEINRWIYDNIDTEGSKHNYTAWRTGEFRHEDYYEFADEPTGTEQDDGEYCEQHEVGCTGDCFQGVYYYPTEKGNYFYFDYYL